MTRTMMGFCVATAFSMVAVGAAQERSSTTTSEPRATTSASQDSNRDITVTGCLARGADGKFMLNEVARNEEANKAASTTTATSGERERNPAATGTSGAAAGSTMAHQSWALEGKDSDLAEHVGHRVELKGRLMSSAASASTTTAPGASSSTTTAGAASTTAAAGAAANAKFDVQSVKTVAASCGS